MIPPSGLQTPWLTWEELIVPLGAGVSQVSRWSAKGKPRSSVVSYQAQENWSVRHFNDSKNVRVVQGETCWYSATGEILLDARGVRMLNRQKGEKRQEAISLHMLWYMERFLLNPIELLARECAR